VDRLRIVDCLLKGPCASVRVVPCTVAQRGDLAFRSASICSGYFTANHHKGYSGQLGAGFTYGGSDWIDSVTGTASDYFSTTGFVFGGTRTAS